MNPLNAVRPATEQPVNGPHKTSLASSLDHRRDTENYGVAQELTRLDALLNCEHPDRVLVWALISNGRRQLRNQCSVCGALVGAALKHDLASHDTPTMNSEALATSNLFWQRCRALLDQEREAARNEWWKNYDAYLSTPEWRERRQLVLERAGGICEGCGANRATQVHHLTYENVGDEFLWQLRAVCEDCHAKAHPEKFGCL